VKLSNYRHAGAKGQRNYSSYSFLTSALDDGKRSASLLAMLYFWYPLHMRLGGLQNWSGHRLEEKSFTSVGDRTPVVQSEVRNCTDCAVPAPSSHILTRGISQGLGDPSTLYNCLIRIVGDILERKLVKQLKPLSIANRQNSRDNCNLQYFV
jgi:hypothetical protein